LQKDSGNNNMADDIITGLQHIGNPSPDIEKTIKFYTELGFKTINAEHIPGTEKRVVFMKLKDVVMEIWEEQCSGTAAGTAGIDHIAFNVTQIDKLFKTLKQKKLNIVDSEIKFLPYWESGIKYFIITGPDNQKIEFCQIEQGIRQYSTNL
jgi:lactoylglutathione lyase